MSLEARTMQANWKVLAAVLYGADGVFGFSKLKKAQWRVERAASLVQMQYRRNAVMRRVRARSKAKEDAAARTMQYYYKNKLQLGHAANEFFRVAQEQLRVEREERARIRAQRRQEELLRMSAAERDERRRRRILAVRTALQEYAAADLLQRVVRGALARNNRKKLRSSSRPFCAASRRTPQGTPRKIIGFQRRVRLWLAHRLFHTFYEEHRQFLLIQRTQEHFGAVERYLDSKDPPLALAEAEALASEAEWKARVKEVSQTQLALARTQGELDGLLESANGYALIGNPRAIAEAKQQQAMLGTELEALRDEAENRLLDATEAVKQHAKRVAASKATSEITGAHPIVTPMLLGQQMLLDEGGSNAKEEADRLLAATRASWDAVRAKAHELALADALAKPGMSDVRERAEKAEKLADRLPSMRAVAAAALPARGVPRCGALGRGHQWRAARWGSRQRCHWRQGRSCAWSARRPSRC